MIYTVSLTSQGQISIPAKLRKKLGLEKSHKALITEQAGKLVIEPVKDFLELRGSLKTARKVKVTPGKMRAAFEQYLANEAVGKNE